MTMRIEQQASFLSDLLRSARQGFIAPAAFQRPYVWSKSDVEALCDSVLSGFPVGSFLVWEPPQDLDLGRFARDRLGPIALMHTTTNRRSNALLLDGQNRLASLAWLTFTGEDLSALSPLSVDEQRTWCSGETLVADFESRSLRFVPTGQAEQGLRIPAHRVVFSDGAGRYLFGRWEAWNRDHPADQVKQAMDWLDSCQSAFREARVTQTRLCNATVNEARHAFQRICKVGVPMAPEDFDRAIGWSAGIDPNVSTNLDHDDRTTINEIVPARPRSRRPR